MSVYWNSVITHYTRVMLDWSQSVRYQKFLKHSQKGFGITLKIFLDKIISTNAKLSSALILSAIR